MAFPRVVSRLLDKKKPEPAPPPLYRRPTLVAAHGLIPWDAPPEPKPCPEGKCLMSANAANRVKDAVERVVNSLEKAADGTAERLNRLTEEAMDKFHRVEKSVSDPLEQALKGLDELLGSNGGPPLE